MIPVQQLTPDQAAEELGALLDAKFLVEEDVIALHHWKTEHAQRQTDLEMWLMLHPPIPQDAPPQQLATTPEAPKEKPMDHLKLTPKQRLENLTAAYADALEKVQSDLTSKKLRSMVANLKHSIKALCTSYKLTLPELVPVPPLGDPKPKGTTRPQDKPVKKAPAPPKALPRKVAEGEAHPYEPPTAGDLREALDVLLHAPETSYIPTVTDPVCGSAGLPRMEFSICENL